MRVILLAIEGNLPSALLGLVDIFWLASQAAKQNPNATPWLIQEVLVVSVDGQPIHDGRGKTIDVDCALADIQKCDAVLIPGLMPAQDGMPPRGETIQAAATWLSKQYQQGALLCGSCAGVFVLGEAGLLNQRRCTTTWWLHDELRNRFPKADVAWGAAWMMDQRIMTVGGPLSWIGMALSAIKYLAGTEAAKLAADFAVIDWMPMAQSAYMPVQSYPQHDAFLAAAENIVRQQQREATLSTKQLAKNLAVSERTLHRRLVQLGQGSPKAFIARIQLETARSLLESEHLAIKAIAQHCGYQDGGNFRRAFQKHTGMNPSVYRQWSRQRRGITP